MKKPRAYTAKQIHVATDIEGVRTNPGMYLGSIDRLAALQCFKEIEQNAGDEMGEVGGGIIRVLIEAPRAGETHGWVTVADQGRGIPVERHPATGLSTLETVLVKLHAGGKSTGKSAYGKRTIGVHGVGAAVTNGCSAEFQAWTFRNAWYHAAFECGTRTRAVSRVDHPPFPWPRGTIIRYRLDASVLPDAMMLTDAQQLCGLARYWDPLTIQYRDPERRAVLEPRTPEQLFRWALRQQGECDVLVGPVVVNQNGVRAVAAWTTCASPAITASVAGAPVPSGTHVRGLEEAATEALRRAGGRGLDGAVGLVAVLDVSVDRPAFSGQNKTNLRTTETQGRVREACTQVLAAALRKGDKAAVVAHATRIGTIDQKAATDRDLAKTARKGGKGKNALPLGFKSATGYPAEQRELFLLEGDSAEGTASDARMPWQEVLPLRGKLPNLVRRAGLASNEVVGRILAATGYRPDDPTRPLRVGKIILLADSDDDGDHITVLATTVLQQVMPSVLARGLVYVVVAPLYEAMTARGEQVTGNSLAEVQAHGALRSVNRMKGWGGCEAPLLRKVAFDPETRSWLRIEPPTTGELKDFELLLGQDSQGRKKLIGASEAPREESDDERGSQERGTGHAARRRRTGRAAHV